MKTVFLAAALLFGVLTLAPGEAGAVMVHDFACFNCHGRDFVTEGLPNEVCLVCHSSGNNVPIQRFSNPATQTNAPSGLFEAGDASNLMGSYPAGLSPGDQTSHMWNASDEKSAAGAAVPTRDEFYSWYYGISNGRVTCSRCHDIHAQKESNPQLLRLGAGSAETMCLDCHSAWNTSNNRGRETHPIVADYAAKAAANPQKFRSAPDNFGTNGNITLVDGNRVSCTSCHAVHWADSDSSTTDGKAHVATLHTGDGRILKFDGPDKENPSQSLCQTCHNYPKHGGEPSIGCMVCHGSHEYDPAGNPNYFMLRKQVTLKRPRLDESTPEETITVNLDYTKTPAPGNFDGYNGICMSCHYGNLSQGHNADRAQCSNCHTHQNGFGHGAGSSGLGCVECHGHDAGTPIDPDASYPYTPGAQLSQGRGTVQSHSTHTELDTDDVRGPGIYCDSCHDINDFPYFKSGTDTNGDGKFSLSETNVCDPCHSAGGAFNGISSTNGSVGAKDNWKTGAYNADGSLQAGKEKWCIGCHDDSPAVISGETAPNKAGDNNTYGFYVTGHGKSGAYAKLSWQDGAAAGNPGANRACSECHDSRSAHITAGPNPANRRLLAGYENDQNNSNCNSCHKTGGSAVAEPQWYTTSAEYEKSAHKGVLCSSCHDVHGGTVNPAMTKGKKEQLCYQCHTDGMVQNNAVSGPDLATNIKQAFSMAEKHDLGTQFGIGGSSYTLECVSCHNVHLITGKYWQAEEDKSPVTRISIPGNNKRNLEVWGDEPGEKMFDYGGTYRTPSGETYNNTQLPDYATFCLECHGQASTGHKNFGINWAGDPHGLNSANSPNGGGACPDWFACGKAEGWDNDTCVGTEEQCWPAIPRGKGDQLFSRGPYNHEERIAGANFVLSCTNCHEAHGSSNSSMVRTNPNNGTGTVIWNTMCNNCHYYYSDWHAGMSCANASCHVSDRMSQTGSNSLHQMSNAHGSGATRGFNPDLVLNYGFNGNLNDSGDWRMHGKWMDNIASSFTTGRNGQALLLDGGKNVQVGTRNDYWSTDAGRHGTWVYTEMKNNTTLEAWVYPTQDTGNEYIIFSKHTGVNDGGYQFSLRKVNGSLRASFITQIDNNGSAQDGRAGLRGAFSRIAVPLNRWTHVAATFDKTGPDRNTADPSAGRIRIYVNGEEVTTSDATGNYRQPGTGETSMYAYSENSPWNEGICYEGHWCASEFSIGGFYGWQNEFIGRLDDANVWNITKDAAYFAQHDATTSPYISSVEGIIGSNKLTVTFSEGVYAAVGATGALEVGDFVLTDSDNGRTITAVNHTAASATATLTLSTPLDDTADFGVDSLAAATNAIFDNNGKAADTAAVLLSMTTVCPSGEVRFELNEAPGSTYAFDNQTTLPGRVVGSGTLTSSALFSDGAGNYIDFDKNNACLQATTGLTIETRIKPTGLDGTANYIRRILARDSGNANYQLSVWRNNSWGNYAAPAGTASIALWVKPVDAHGGLGWKPVLTDYASCPIVSDHWYKVKAVWDTRKAGGTPGQFFSPGDIYIDDLGTDGAGAGEKWPGYANCTDADQSLKADAHKFYSGDEISQANGDFTIGTNVGNHANNVFKGLIDWIIWKNAPDCSGVDNPPN